jgi:hypothetical protein
MMWGAFSGPVTRRKSCGNNSSATTQRFSGATFMNAHADMTDSVFDERLAWNN